MPIEFFQDSSEMQVRQSFVSPTVYLDHWAIRQFTDDLDIQDRLINALQNKGGTLLLSNISFTEFSTATDPRHAVETERFIDRLFPNIYFTDFALDKLLRRERSESNNSTRFWPSADLDQLKFYAERKKWAELEFPVPGLLTLVHENRADMAAVMHDVVQLIKGGLEAVRVDGSYLTKARMVKPTDSRPRTLVILGELMRGFYLDPRAPILDNDVIDMLHAAMPLNCCDYVLLDGAWAERVAKMKDRIEKSGSIMPLAKCFSKRNHGVEAFIKDLEAFDRNSFDSIAIP